MLTSLTPRSAALLILVVAFATIAGAWVFEYWGYPPCELCLKQRWAYYAGVPLALLIALLAPASPGLARAGLWVMALVWLASMGFGIYHSGVEWGLWPGPSSCTGIASGGLPDLTKPIVMCDKPAVKPFGLSLASWNALISLALAAVAGKGASAQGSSSVSQ